MQIQVAFQDGFANDDVVIRVNGREVLREPGLSGRDPLVPVAAVRQIEIEPAAGQVQVDVPTRGLSRGFDVNFRESPYLGVAIVGNEITLRRSSRPFEYA